MVGLGAGGGWKIIVLSEATELLRMSRLRELRVTGAAKASPQITHVLSLTMKESCEIAKSATIGPSELNQARPRITSVPTTGRINKGT